MPESSAEPTRRTSILWGTVFIVASGVLILALNMRPPGGEDAEVVKHVTRAQDLLRKENFASAVVELREAVRLAPRRSDLRRSLAEALLHDNRADEALGELKAALAVTPDDIPLNVMYAEGLEEQGRLPEALDQFRKLIDLCPESAEPRAHTAQLLEDLGQREQALALWQEAAALDPNDELARLRKGLLAGALKGSASACGSFQQAVRDLPQSAALHFHLALALAQAGQKEEALRAAGKAAELNPKTYAGSAEKLVSSLDMDTRQALYCIPLREAADGRLYAAGKLNDQKDVSWFITPDTAQSTISTASAHHLSTSAQNPHSGTQNSPGGIRNSHRETRDSRGDAGNASAPTPTRHTGGISNEIADLPGVLLATVTIGPLRERDVALSIDESSSTGRLLHGSLGRDFLNRFHFLFDPDSRHLVVLPR